MAQAGDDLRVRDAVLRGFPEVWQVVGKAGRAETATDPAPLDMIETVVNLRDRRLWPKRKLRFEDAMSLTGSALDALAARGLLERPGIEGGPRGPGQRGGHDGHEPGRRGAPRPGPAAAG